MGLLAGLAAPWMFKFLWAPVVDRWWSPRLGRRRSWIVPLQALLVLACLAAAAVHDQVWLLLGLVFVMNLLAATQDVAVDGLAVDLLGKDDLGPGNAVQVVGYKLGMILGGGVLVWASASLALGWGALFSGMAAVTAVVLGVSLVWREPPPPPEAEAPPDSMGQVLQALKAALAAPGGGALILFVGTYRLGEACIDAMYKPFLVDAKVSLEDYGLWVGTYGAVATVAGSLLGGWLAMRFALPRVLGWALVLRCLPLGAWAALALRFEAGHVQLPASALVANVIVEHLASGVLTTAMFAFMMSCVDRRIGASHYTLLASVEVIGKMTGAFSGVLADRVGYGGLFVGGTLVSLALTPLLRPALLAMRSAQEGTRREVEKGADPKGDDPKGEPTGAVRDWP